MKTQKPELTGLLKQLGVNKAPGIIGVHSPIDGRLITGIPNNRTSTVNRAIARGVAASAQWANVQAPNRGRLIQILGQILVENKETLAKVITLECGKPYTEALGEVQEVIDLRMFAAGRATQPFSSHMQSERGGYMLETNWHPIGLTGVITAFNFPHAVLGWNAVITVMCGNGWICKPSELAPLSALCFAKMFDVACKRYNKTAPASQQAPEYLGQVITGAGNVGAQLVEDKRVPLISFTGSTRVGKKVGQIVTQRMGRSILELGGNNPLIVAESADMDKVIPGIAFGVLGTTGQRCTSTRRVLVHRSRYDEVVTRLKSSFVKLRANHIGNPFDNVVAGPLINRAALDAMLDLKKTAEAQGATVHYDGELKIKGLKGGVYTGGMIIEADKLLPFMQEETFAPAVSIVPFDTLEEAVKMANDSRYGLSSAIYTEKYAEWQYFLKRMQAGIVNWNTGTSGAEAWLGFGGMKETGWGRESGAEAWKSYMYETSSAIHVSGEVALAQGISPELFK